MPDASSNSPDVGPEKLTVKQRLLNYLRYEMLTVLTVLSLILGALLGPTLELIRPHGKNLNTAWTEREIMYIGIPGELGSGVLQGLTLPLVMSSIISALGSTDLRLGRLIIFRSIPLCISTTFFGAWIGIISAALIQPGKRITDVELHEEDEDRGAKLFRHEFLEDTFYDTIRNLIPGNIIQAMVERARTNLTKPLEAICPGNCSLDKYDISIVFDDGVTNYAGVVFFCITFGLGVSRVGIYGRPILAFMESLTSAMTKFSRWAVWVTPIATISWMASKLLKFRHLQEHVDELATQTLAVAVATTFLGLVVLPGIYSLTTGRLPFSFLQQLLPAIVIGFATQSSLTTFPVTLRCLDRMGVKPRISRIVLPIGYFLGLSGLSAYLAVTGLYLAQVEKVDVTFGQIVSTSFMATWGSIYASMAAVPPIGAIVQVAAIYSIPAEVSAVTSPFYWLMEAMSTSASVVSYSVLAACVSDIFEKDLNRLSPYCRSLRDGYILKHLSQLVDEQERALIFKHSVVLPKDPNPDDGMVRVSVGENPALLDSGRELHLPVTNNDARPEQAINFTCAAATINESPFDDGSSPSGTCRIT